MNIKGFISSELRFPTSTSTKKKRYVTFSCPSCGQIEEKVYIKSQFVNLCSHCAKGGFTTQDFIKRGIQNFGNFYDYSKTEYINKRSDVVIICPVHGEFTQKAQEHLSGNGCRKCADSFRKENLTIPKEVWIEKLKQYPLISCNNLDSLKGYHSTVTLTCKRHGEFSVAVGKIGTSKYLCKRCADFAHSKQPIRKQLQNSKGILYYCYLSKIDKYKLGVTVNVEQRYKSLQTDVKKILEVEWDYDKLIEIEHNIHTSLEHLRYVGPKLIKDGSTELYNEDILDEINRAIP